MWNRTVWLVWLIVIPLALILGYLLATPDDLMSFGVVSMVLFTLCLPLFLRWHYLLLIVSWNASVIIFFFPGSPYLWVILSIISLSISVIRRTLDKEATFLKAPSITLPLLFLGAIVLLTAKFTGGIGLAALGGSTVGGKKYFYIFTAIIGYFALTARSIPKDRAKLYSVLFFLSGLTAVVSNLAFVLGPSFYFLYGFFPAEFAFNQAMTAEGLSNPDGLRLIGLQFGGLAVLCALLVHGGLRDVFNLRRPWKLLLFISTIFVSLLSGFRSLVVIFGLLFIFMFCLQKLYRTSLFPKLLFAGILSAALVLPFVSKMPFSVQRALSVLPIEVEPGARDDARGSTEWRLEMWGIVVPQIPQYLFKGKGYALDPTDLYLTELLSRYGLAGHSDLAILAGDYHSGPLSLLIPFGIFGALGFVWFLAASLHALYRNYRYGDPELWHINAFLFAYFLTKSVFFFLVFGSLHSDLFVFIGLIGLSISLNGGVKKPVARTQLQPENAVLVAA